jgi:hypothetical protein
MMMVIITIKTRKIFGAKKNEVSNFGYYVMRNFVIRTTHLILLG